MFGAWGAPGAALFHRWAGEWKYGIICPVGECEPQAKHEPGGIDAMFLSEHDRYAKCELKNMV